jgi:carboxymethylenebutenolidase
VSGEGLMGQTIELEAADGHLFSAYEAAPHAAHHRGGLVIVQEIFGVNAHIRRVADGYADDGYYVIAPAIFDRDRPGIELAADQEGMAAGRAAVEKIGLDAMLLDIDAARAAAASAGKVGIVGYCLGGSLAWLAATRLDGFAAASCYYGSRIAATADEKPRCPVQMHFGDKDQSISAADVEKIRENVPSRFVEIFVYPAGHAFNRDGGASWEPNSAKLARERTLKLFGEHVG